MKALSLWQPWAWLVANGWKTIENRPWNCLFREKILIHAGLHFSRKQYDEVVTWCTNRGFDDAVCALPLPDHLELGGIIGVANIDGVLRPGTVDHAPLLANRTDIDVRWHMADQYGITLRNARPTTFVPTPGRQRWWTPPPSVAASALLRFT